MIISIIYFFFGLRAWRFPAAFCVVCLFVSCIRDTASSSAAGLAHAQWEWVRSGMEAPELEFPPIQSQSFTCPRGFYGNRSTCVSPLTPPPHGSAGSPPTGVHKVWPEWMSAKQWEKSSRRLRFCVFLLPEAQQLLAPSQLV